MFPARVPESESPLVNWTLSLPPARSTDSNEVKFSPSIVPWLAPVRIRVLSAPEATRLSLLLVPVRLSKPETMPLITALPPLVTPPVVVVPALLVMPLRVTETAAP